MSVKLSSKSYFLYLKINKSKSLLGEFSDIQLETSTIPSKLFKIL